MKKRFVNFAQLGAVLTATLTGCQTTGVRPGIDPVLGMLAAEAISDSCNIVSTSDSSYQTERPVPPGLIFIENVSPPLDGWMIADFKYSGPGRTLSGQATFNLETQSSVCFSVPNDPQISPALLTYSILSKPASDVMRTAISPPIQASMFPIKMSWPDSNQEFSGETIWMRNFDKYDASRSGWISVRSPDSADLCKGMYRVTPKRSGGTWSLHCPNNVSVSGEFDLAYKNSFSKAPDNVKAFGRGVDSLGRKVGFTMPWSYGPD